MWRWPDVVTAIILARNRIICLVLCNSSRTITIKPDFILPPFSEIVRCSEQLSYVKGFGLVDKSGHADLLARDDLAEPVKYMPERHNDKW